MLKINEVQLYSEPREIIPKIQGKTEMTEFESAFLCGLLKKINAKKCIEVGIAEGGTTAVIMECLSLLNSDNKYMPEIYGVDLSKKLYNAKNSFDSGFLAKIIFQKL